MQLPMVLRVLLLVTTQGCSKSCIITKCCPKRTNKVTIIDMKNILWCLLYSNQYTCLYWNNMIFRVT